MFVRTLFVGVSCVAALSSTAVAQCGSVRPLPSVQLARQIAPIIDNMSRESSEVSLPSINELARQATHRVDSRYQSCESHRIQNQQWAAKQEAARKKAASASARTKQWTDDELAASKYQAAHGLWQAGKTDAARRWLDVVLRDYSTTPTADRARAVLTKL